MPMFLTVNFLHKKPAEQRIREYILQLSQNRNTTFGSSVSQFESSTKHEAANLSYQQLLSNVRNHIDSIRDKLLTDHHKELVEHGMKVILLRHELNTIYFHVVFDFYVFSHALFVIY